MTTLVHPEGRRPLFRGWHAEAEYRREADGDYAGNCLIEALPALQDRATVARRTTHLPNAWTDADRARPAHEREHRLARVGQFKIPLSQDLALHDRLQEIVRGGYMSRNPFAPRYTADMDERLAGMAVMQQAVCARPHQLTTLGASGGGKTQGYRAGLSVLPQTVRHKAYRGRPFLATQVVWLILDCPHNGSARELCSDFFTALDEVVATMPDAPPPELRGRTFAGRYDGRGVTAADLLKHMAAVAAMVHLGVLVLDEVQVLSEAHSGGASALLNFLLKLVNTLGVPVVLVGTYKAYRLLAPQLRLARRANGEGFWEPLPLVERVLLDGAEVDQPGGDWALFTEALWRYQLTRAPIPRTAALLDRLHHESQGIPDIAVKLFAVAQRRAIQQGEQTGVELVTPALITDVAERELRLVRPIIRAMQNGAVQPEVLAKLDDVVLPSLERLLGVQVAPELHTSDLTPPSTAAALRAAARDVKRLPATARGSGEVSPAECPEHGGGAPQPRGTTRRTSRRGSGPGAHGRTPPRPAPDATDQRAGDVGLGPTLRQLWEEGQTSGRTAHESFAAAGLVWRAVEDVLLPTPDGAALDARGSA